jgi:hypothetical protein
LGLQQPIALGPLPPNAPVLPVAIPPPPPPPPSPPGEPPEVGVLDNTNESALLRALIPGRNWQLHRAHAVLICGAVAADVLLPAFLGASYSRVDDNDGGSAGSGFVFYGQRHLPESLLPANTERGAAGRSVGVACAPAPARTARISHCVGDVVAAMWKCIALVVAGALPQVGSMAAPTFAAARAAALATIRSKLKLDEYSRMRRVGCFGGPAAYEPKSLRTVRLSTPGKQFPVARGLRHLCLHECNRAFAGASDLIKLMSQARLAYSLDLHAHEIAAEIANTDEQATQDQLDRLDTAIGKAAACDSVFSLPPGQHGQHLAAVRKFEATGIKSVQHLRVFKSRYRDGAHKWFVAQVLRHVFDNPNSPQPSSAELPDRRHRRKQFRDRLLKQANCKLPIQVQVEVDNEADSAIAMQDVLYDSDTCEVDMDDVFDTEMMPVPQQPPPEPPPPPDEDPPPLLLAPAAGSPVQPEPKLVFVYHFDFLKENTPKRGGMPSRTFVNRLQQQMRASAYNGQSSAVYSAQMSEQYTSKMNAYLRYSQAAADDYNRKDVPIADNERPLPAINEQGEWCRYEEPRAHRRIRQRDELAALVQAYALILFMNCQQRPDALSFPWQIEERKKFDATRQMTRSRENGNVTDGAALRSHICAWRNERTGKLRARSPTALAAALYGVCKI